MKINVTITQLSRCILSDDELIKLDIKSIDDKFIEALIYENEKYLNITKALRKTTKKRDKILSLDMTDVFLGTADFHLTLNPDRIVLKQNGVTLGVNAYSSYNKSADPHLSISDFQNRQDSMLQGIEKLARRIIGDKGLSGTGYKLLLEPCLNIVSGHCSDVEISDVEIRYNVYAEYEVTEAIHDVIHKVTSQTRRRLRTLNKDAIDKSIHNMRVKELLDKADEKTLAELEKQIKLRKKAKQ